MEPAPDFDTLVEAHSAGLYAYLWRLLREPADAEDCLQESLLRAYRGRDALAGHPNPAAWLYRIATNTARTHQKRQARAAAHTTLLDPERLPLAAAGPAAQVDQALALEAVAQAVEALPHQQRAALLLRKYQGLSYAEIGTVLDCTPAAARANVYQALRKLRVMLAEEAV